MIFLFFDKKYLKGEQVAASHSVSMEWNKEHKLWWQKIYN